MTIQAKLLCAVAVSAFAVFAATSPAQALTSQECSAKYQAAKTAGTLAGQKWNDFRKAECGADAAAAASCDGCRRPRTRQPSRRRKPRPLRPLPHRPVPPRSPPRWIRNIPRRPPARRGCTPASDQWKANKAANTTGGMKWIEKGGGYWSECNKKLKA